MKPCPVLLLCVWSCLLASITHALPGDLDPNFGTGGKVTIPIGSGDDRGHAVAMQSDGKVVVGGYSHNGSNKDFRVVRYNVDGAQDRGFGTEDKVTIGFGGTNDIANSVAVQANGRMIVTVHAQPNIPCYENVDSMLVLVRSRHWLPLFLPPR